MKTKLRPQDEACATCLVENVARLKAANEKLESFAYIACHDLRAPLRAMMELPGWIREDLIDTFGQIPPNILRDLHEIAVQSQRMDRLVKDLLEFSLIDARTGARDTLDSNLLIADCIATAGVPPGFCVHVAPDLPAIQCSAVEFSVAMRNLIANAIKHHDRDNGSISVNATCADGMAEFHVVDDGPGIDPTHAEDVFEMFKTLRPKEETGSSGIGLGMVRKIAQRYGGTVSVTAAPSGRGSDFMISFPLADSASTCRKDPARAQGFLKPFGTHQSPRTKIS